MKCFEMDRVKLFLFFFLLSMMSFYVVYVILCHVCKQSQNLQLKMFMIPRTVSLLI